MLSITCTHAFTLHTFGRFNSLVLTIRVVSCTLCRAFGWFYSLRTKYNGWPWTREACGDGGCAEFAECMESPESGAGGAGAGAGARTCLPCAAVGAQCGGVGFQGTASLHLPLAP